MTAEQIEVIMSDYAGQLALIAGRVVDSDVKVQALDIAFREQEGEDWKEGP